MFEKKLTVLTPTYNRASTLGRLFESLCKQTRQEFTWLVVDDGSTDGTDALICSYQRKSIIDIKYFYQSNGGKHTALNRGIEICDTPLLMIVDSDDYLLPDAVSQIIRMHIKYQNDSTIGCYSFLRCYPDGTPVLSIDCDEVVSNYIDYRIKGNRPGDMAEVFITRWLKKFRFPEFNNEKFLSEDVVWIELGKYARTVYIKTPVYVCEYLEGGLTATDKKAKFGSPLGSMLRGKKLMSKECGLKANIRGAIIYDCYQSVAGRKTPPGLKADNIYQKILICFMKPISKYYLRKWRKEID